MTLCSPWSASTIVEPTCPAPMTKIFTAGAGYTPRGMRCWLVRSTVRRVRLLAAVCRRPRRRARRRRRRVRDRRSATMPPARQGRRRPSGAGARHGAPGSPGALYVVEQGGLVRVVDAGKIQAQPFLDVRARTRAGGEQGLLGLAFAPDYATSRQFVVNYTDRNGDTRVVRYRSDGAKALPASARQLLLVKQPYANHNGGMVAYGKDGLVYVGMGDGGSGGDPENRAQNPARCSARSSASIRPDPGRSRRSSLSGSATRGDSRSTAEPATSGSATSARARSRRSTTSPGRGKGC